MKEQTANKAKLGAFVLTATLFLILGLYFIGSKRDMFRSAINVSANFNNVGGLLPGNNVRFNGINVGTVSKVYPVSDTAIKVEFTIDEASAEFIRKDAVASIGTDGLLGNKLINISPGKKETRSITKGDVLISLDAPQMDHALRTLASTNDNLKVITDNLKGISEKFNSGNSLWHLLTDSTLAENVRNAVVHFKVTGENTATITGDFSRIAKDLRAGKGTIGALITDTSLSKRLSQTIINIQTVSDSFAVVTGDFKSISSRLKNGDGAVGTLLTDTAFVHNLNQSMQNIKASSENFNENMKALKYSWPFKKYFRKHKAKPEK